MVPALCSDIMTALPEEPILVDAVPAAGLCPFLRSRDGSWTSTHASRDLRCWAVRPAAMPAVTKQRALCQIAAHLGCATFVAASAPDPGVPRPSAGAAHTWPATRTIPVALEPVRAHGSLAVAAPRSGGQALLIGLMVLAFLVLVIARTTAPGSPGASGALPSSPVGSAPAVVASPVTSVSPSPSGAEPSASPSAGSPSPVPSATTRPSSTPTTLPTRPPVPSATPIPAGSRTYVVKSGDTLSSIAAAYHSTVKAIAAANNITDPRLIRVGQVLVIP